MYRSRFWQIRIIPTRMGTSSNNNNKWYCGKDHPHAYGDKLYLPIVWRHSTGSSPRVWGQESAMQTENLPVRIIPTRMGTSIGAKDEFISAEDHPHAYGDKFFGDYTMATYVGSSPRVWGQADFSGFLQCSAGIIPTRMGTSFLPIFCDCIRQDHPHAYGDKSFLISRAQYFPGSSPRVWGQELNVCKNSDIRRIIPTRMGTRVKK